MGSTLVRVTRATSSLTVGALSIGLAACTPPPATGPAPAAPGQPAGAAAAPTDSAGGAAPAGEGTRAEGWPTELLVSSEPNGRLFLGPGADAAAIAVLSPGVVVEPAGAPSGDRLPVRVPGALEAMGWVPVEALSVRAVRTCKVGGTPAYLGPNDVVEALGPARPDRFQVRVRPDLGRPDLARLGPFEGVCPPGYFGGAPVDPAAVEGPSPGRPARLPAGVQVPVHESPGGPVVATLPAASPPLVVVVLREQGAWKGVRVGTGPFLVGFVDAALTPADAPPPATPVALGPPAADPAGMPSVIRGGAASAPRWRVREGTQVTFDGRTVGRAGGAVFAKEMNRFDSGQVDVLVAADDGVAVRGIVPADALVALAGAAPAAPPPAAPAAAAPAPAPAPAATPPAERDEDAPYVPARGLR